MKEIINGENGKYVIFSLTITALGIMSLIGYSMKLGYNSSFNLKDRSLKFNKGAV